MTSGSFSKAFADLKVVKEKIQDNLTTAQYLRILDDLCFRAVKPILVNTTYVDSYVIRLLGWQEKHHRRKICFDKKSQVSALVVKLLLARGPEARIEAYKNMKLDRGIRLFIAQDFLKEQQEYLQACTLSHSMDIDQALKIKAATDTKYRGVDVYRVVQEVKFWLDLAVHFKSLIIEKYTRVTITSARRDFAQLFQGRISLDDVVHVYMIACIRAVDKCDSDKGTLTTHITNWFFTAKEAVTLQASRPGTVALDSVRGVSGSSDSWSGSDDAPSVDIAENIEELCAESHETELLRNEAVADIVLAAKLADPAGYGRLVLGIPELLL